MWNIKSYKTTDGYLRTNGFTLTMWNIKEKAKQLQALAGQCFTLTMWNIKDVCTASGLT